MASERLFMEMADRLAQDGWRDLGYVYLNIDDCWIGGRDSTGNLVLDQKRFPNGIAFLADYVSLSPHPHTLLVPGQSRQPTEGPFPRAFPLRLMGGKWLNL